MANDRWKMILSFHPSPAFIEPQLRFLDHCLNLCEVVECKSLRCQIADASRHDYSGAAASLPEHADLQIALSSIARFKAGEPGCGLVDACYGINRIQQWINLFIIHVSPILPGPLATFSQDDHEPFS